MYQSCYWSWGSEETPQRRIGRLWCRRVVQITCEGQVIGWNGSRIAFVSRGNGSLLMLNAQNSCEIWSISFSTCDKRWSWSYGIQAMTLGYLSHKKKLKLSQTAVTTKKYAINQENATLLNFSVNMKHHHQISCQLLHAGSPFLSV